MADRLKAYQHISSLAEFLLLAEQRPGMYFGSRLLSEVQLVLNGWHLHRRYASDDDPIADAMKGFTKFVEAQYGDDRTMGPFLMIAEHTNDSEREFKEFMRMFREYLDQHPDLSDDPT